MKISQQLESLLEAFNKFGKEIFLLNGLIDEENIPLETREREEKLRALFLQGKTIREVAFLTNLSERQIKRDKKLLRIPSKKGHTK